MFKIQLLAKENMTERSLDNFCRTQNVKREFRLINNEYILVDCDWVMDWSLQKKQVVAKSLFSNEYTAFGALKEGKIIGFVSVEKNLRKEFLVLDMIQVSQSYRNKGLGRKLFQIAKTKAKEMGAKQLYISACSSEETIAFYKAMGCKLAINPITTIAEDEPMDVQMICDTV